VAHPAKANSTTKPKKIPTNMNALKFSRRMLIPAVCAARLQQVGQIDGFEAGRIPAWPHHPVDGSPSGTHTRTWIGVARANAMPDDLNEWRRLVTGRWDNWLPQPAGHGGPACVADVVVAAAGGLVADVVAVGGRLC
jgi:hypothetical protein